MKKIYMFIAVCLAMISQAAGQVAVNTDGALPVPSAMLEVTSTTKGMLIPRMTTAQRTAIASPATGLLVYDNTTQSFWYYYPQGWKELASGGIAASSYIEDADGTTRVETEKNPNENKIRFTLTGAERMRLESKWLNTTFPNYGLSIGDSAGASNVTGYDNTFIGYHAGRYNTTGDYNTFIGKDAGQANTSGANNTFTGRSSGFRNTTGYHNSFYGMKSGIENTTGLENSFFGYYSGFYNTTGYKNTYIGTQAGFNNKTGDANTAIGFGALMAVDSSKNRMTAVGYAIGSLEGEGYKTGSYSTMIGSELEANGEKSILIGHNIKPIYTVIPSKNYGYWGSTENTIVIGNDISVSAYGLNSILLGGPSQTSFYCHAALGNVYTGSGYYDLYIDAYGQIGVLPSPSTTNADISDIGNIDWLYNLRPVNYIFNSDEKKTKQCGLVAEEVAKVAPECVSYNKDKQTESVSYTSLVAPLLKAVQDQKTFIEQLQKEVEVLKNR
jgi:hypothetical protein